MVSFVLLLMTVVGAVPNDCDPDKHACEVGFRCLPLFRGIGYCGMPTDALAVWNTTTNKILLPASKLKGAMSDLSSLTNLEVLDVSKNLNLEKGPIWSWLEKLAKLRVLKLAKSGRTGAMNAIDWSIFSETLGDPFPYLPYIDALLLIASSTQLKGQCV